ncbi:hypothetical protein Taro_026237 [Colocasia esculenta]|uniref:Uncharacterized protein n=1 Tax=Colocasia esculenta TaxID=4460 RepID=A0A843VEN8_COLES|nr:hypothetical protein [Colocasia esculenta]
MLRPQVQAATSGPSGAGFTLFGCRAAVLPRHRETGSLLPCVRRVQVGRVGGGRKGSTGDVRCSSTSREVQAAVTRTQESSTKVKAVVTVKITVGGLLTNVGLSRGLDDITDLLGKSLYVELVSAELDPGTLNS